MLKWIRTAFALVLVLGLLVVAFVTWVLPNYAARRLELLVNENCVTCAITVGELHFHLATPRRIDFANLLFTNGEHNSLQLKVRIPTARIELNWLALLKDRIEITQVVCDQPEVTVTSGPRPQRFNAFALQDNLKFKFGVADVVSHGGEFKLVYVTARNSPTLSLHNIEAKISDLGTLFQGKTAAHASAQIEQSGTVNLDISGAPFEKTPQMDAKLELTDQNLSDFSSFFTALSETDIAGILVRGRVHMTLHDSHLSAQIGADYRDFRAQASAPNAVAALMRTLSARLTTKRRPASISDGPTVLKRLNGESLSRFILRGLDQEAAKAKPYR